MPYKDPEVAKARSREYYAANRARIAARNAADPAYREANRLAQRKWRARNPGKARAHLAALVAKRVG